jgi:unsaturated rhamnogalacturonyl hydrolase
MKFTAPVLLLCLLNCVNGQESKTAHFRKSPEGVAHIVIADLLSRPDFMMYTVPPCTAVHYAEACAGFGAARLAAFLGDKPMLEKLTARYARVIDDNITNTANHVDANVYGILPLELFIHNKEERFFRQGIDLADGQWTDPLPDGMTSQTRYWIDDIWMIGSLQVQAYRATGKMEYLERAALEINAYILRLQQPNGLFFHGPDAPFFWGRGNGWVAAGMAELLSELPKTNPYYGSILKGYQQMMTTLAKYQAEDGMWRQLIDNSGSFRETSSTAMFGYAMTVGIKKELLPRRPFGKASLRAWKALTTYINDDGKINNVCVGTGQSLDINYYLTRPITTGDLHGQAPVLWFAYALLVEY